MQYIKKQYRLPEGWNKNLTTATGNPLHDYRQNKNLGDGQLQKLRKSLLDEQGQLCGYCQRRIYLGNSSIEHVIPNSQNVENSTNYYNLIAVCDGNKNQNQDETHCDKSRGNKLLPPIVFYNDADFSSSDNIPKTNTYFLAKPDGSILEKENLTQSEKQQVLAFINTLNLNHNSLKIARKRAFEGVISGLTLVNQSELKSKIAPVIENNRGYVFRQYLLSLIYRNI